MTEFKGQTAITIQAPVEKVYAYLADFRRHPEWVNNVSKVTQLTAGPIEVGTTFKCEEGPPPVALGQRLKMMAYFMAGVFSGAKTYSEAKITGLEANRRITWQAGVPKGDRYFSYAEWEFIFDSQDGATHLTQRFRYAPPEPVGQRMISATTVEGIQQSCAVSLTQLKRRLETSTNGLH